MFGPGRDGFGDGGGGGQAGTGLAMAVEGARVLATGNTSREVRIDWKEIETPGGEEILCAFSGMKWRGGKWDNL